MTEFESAVPAEVRERFAEARKRVEAKIAAAGGEEAYRKQREEEQRKEDEQYFASENRRATGEMLGERFKQSTFSTFVANANNREALKVCRQFVTEYRKDRRGLMITGNNGIGKNHLVAAITNALSERNVRMYVGSITKIKSKICDAFSSSVEDAIEKLIDYDVICINDLGVEKDTEWAKELLFDLIDRMYEAKKPIIVTTNLSNAQLYEKYGPRIISRLIGMCDAVEYKDTDHRVESCKG